MTKKDQSQKPSSKQENGVDRRNFLISGAAVGIAAAGAGIGAATAQPASGQAPKTNSPSGKRVAIITDTRLNIGPHLARKMAPLNYNLVIADVPDGLPEELEGLGAAKVVVVPGLEQEGPNNEGRPGAIQKVVDAAMKEFGGFDSAFIRTAIHVGKDILEETPENMQISYEQNCLAVMYALQAVLPPLVKAGAGQVVVQTSATGQTVAPKGVCVNSVGTNFMNYPGFRESAGAEDPEVYQSILNEIPMRRLGETEEAAHFTLALLDGYNMYTTGNNFPIAGGFRVLRGASGSALRLR